MHHFYHRPVFSKHALDYLVDSTNMNEMTKNIWLAVFGTFLMWWMFQLWLNVAKMRTSTHYQSIPASTFEGPPMVTWLDKLKSATNVSRDCFIMIFSAAIVVSVVGATRWMAVFAWIFFGLSLIWQFMTLASVSPAVHVLFTLVTAPFLIAIVITALNMIK